MGNPTRETALHLPLRNAEGVIPNIAIRAALPLTIIYLFEELEAKNP